MKLVVLSRSRTIPSTRRLCEAAKERGHTVRVMGPTDVEVHLDARTTRLKYGGRRIRPPNVVIPRIASSVASYGLPVLEQFALHGSVVMNSAHAIGQSRNPARCLQLLAAHGLDIPKTVMARRIDDLKESVRWLGGLPVLVKLIQGTERRGLMVCESEQSLEASLQAVLGLGHNIVLQQYVRRASRDLRVFVVGGRAVAAVCRTPRAGRLSRSLSHHGTLEAIEMSAVVRSVAERAARICGLEVCAVDLLEIKQGTKVFEVNASPALPDMEAATGIDLAQVIIERAEQLFGGTSGETAL